MDETEQFSLFDEKEDAETAARLDAEAEADVAAGRVVPHAKVAEWLEKLARGERVPPPKA
jgi:predicted transcriptional regulator